MFVSVGVSSFVLGKQESRHNGRDKTTFLTEIFCAIVASAQQNSLSYDDFILHVPQRHALANLEILPFSNDN